MRSLFINEESFFESLVYNIYNKHIAIKIKRKVQFSIHIVPGGHRFAIYNNVRLIIEGQQDASIILVDDGAADNDEAMMIQTVDGTTKFRSIDEGTAAVLEYLHRCRAHYDPRGAAVFPPWFAAAAWPCFVDSMCDTERSYYLSANEPMLACELRRRNFAVFGRRHGEASFLGAVAGHADSPLVMLILHLDNDEGRVRSHYRKLILAEDVQQAQEHEQRETE